MISHGIPDTFVDIMVLAGVIIFAITTLSALLCSIFVTRNNLLYLGLQLALLFIVLSMSENWSYPLWFDAIFATLEDFHQTVRALLILSIGFTIDMAIRFFVWDVMIKRDGRLAVPKLLVAVIRALIYLFAGLTIMQFVYGQSITALATLSGAFALIIGLSAQSTLGEMFAGIAIALSQPFRVGDWVKVGSLDEGQVVDMTWRLVRIETRDRNIINVTNRVVADSPVKNFSFPNHVVRIGERIFFSQDDDVAVVQALLDRALTAAPGLAVLPPPNVLYRGTLDGVSEFAMRYYIADYKDKDSATESVWRSVIDHVKRSPHRIITPRRQIELIQDLPADAVAAFVRK